jgi:folylpolyglutamate synthase/dihydropteroate synthase
VVDRFVMTAAGNTRAARPELLVERSPAEAVAVTGPRKAIAEACQTGPDLVLVSGSFLLVAEIREALGRSRSWP